MLKKYVLSPFWGRGFRPFFLFGALYGAVSVMLWAAAYAGYLTLPAIFPTAMHWHAHEMIYGFGVAIVAGFLLTAVANWTGGAPARQVHLLALCALWIAGRVVVNLPDMGSIWLVAAIDSAFIPALAITLSIPLIHSKNHRNFVFLLLLGILFTCDIAFYVMGSLTPIYVALFVICAMISVIGGRIIPAFTFATLRQRGIVVTQINQEPYDIAALMSLLALMASVGIFGTDSQAVAVIAGISFLVHAIRIRGFHTMKAWVDPMLGILHMGYIWLTLGLLAISFSALGWIPFSPALHLLTVGAMGSMILGMICRVALGHTGRRIFATRPMTVLFALMQIAVVVRVGGPLFFPANPAPFIIGASAVWGAIFLTYAVIFFPILTSARPDGGEA